MQKYLNSDIQNILTLDKELNIYWMSSCYHIHMCGHNWLHHAMQ